MVELDTLERVAWSYWGEQGRWAYRAFRWINAELFCGSLPPPLIQWALTPHGNCLGNTQPESPSGAPVITLHPAIWGDGAEHSTEPSRAWGGIDACRLYALDVLVHEVTHVQVGVVQPAAAPAYKSSHDNPWWPAEVERISPLIGLPGVVASVTKRSRRQGRMLRVPAKEGAIPMGTLSRWPHSLRAPDYYRGGGRLPAL